ncbi:hypothetical protein SAMN04487896_3439 [Paenibacillus sp. ov031]|uniref:hypothetical protein n=1 Tax=Paenibacillus sp. ov031 TaxID=1761879 RepID=UPI00091251E3|nr:hypothetical protein [Paenibacillus sp. ov031]SHN74271.1 hypothetical protein SAMN04487896_3439 [Paenibacillus sp. ov031]
MKLKKLLSPDRVLFWVLTFVSFLSIFLVKFVWVNTPPPKWFPWGHEFGELVNNLCIGYIVSVIFYYIVVYIPDKRNKRAANSGIIGMYVPRVLFHSKKILGLLYFKMETEKTLIMLTKDDFRKIERLDPSEPVEFFLGDSGKLVSVKVEADNQGDFLIYHRDAIKESINEMFVSPLIKYVDSDLVHIIGKIKYCRFLNYSISNIAKGNDYLHHREGMYEFYELYMEFTKALNEECLFEVHPDYYTYYKPIPPSF